jgi:uncharacterized SAM-binding protein YcdF (DUF218 family)
MSLRVETPVSVSAPAPRRRRRWRWLGGLVALLVVAGLALVAAAGVQVVRAATSEDRTPTDVIVVLGAAQFWGTPSPVLESRLSHARELYDEGVAERIVTVGGKQEGDIATEAQAGRTWLVENGVPRTSVTAIRTGSDTVTSLEAVADLMAEKGWTSATIVTDPAHTARSLAIAGALGIDAHGSPTTSGDGSALTPEYLARETAGLLHVWLVGQRSIDPRLA